jgi:tRNA1Val (adenine37-N6)-methyltransferase
VIPLVEIFANETIDDLILGGLKVIQKKKGFRFALDAVLLAHFASLKRGNKIIDLGTGTGIIPLILSTRAKDLKITGVEIQQEVAQMARRSVTLNNLKDIEIVNADLRNIGSEQHGQYDLVISNPPYLPIGQGKISPIEEVALSRHELECSLEDLVKSAALLLKNKGNFALVHRPERLGEIISLLTKFKIEPKRIRLVHPFLNKNANLVLIEATKGTKPGLIVHEPLVIYHDDGVYTKEIMEYYDGGETCGK